MASVIFVPRRFRRRRCFQPFTVAAPSSVICSAKLRVQLLDRPAVFRAAQSPVGNSCERKVEPLQLFHLHQQRHVRIGSPTRPQIHRHRLPGAIPRHRAARPFNPTGIHRGPRGQTTKTATPHHPKRHRTRKPHRPNPSRDRKKRGTLRRADQIPSSSHYVFLRLGRAESRSQINWHFGSLLLQPLDAVFRERRVIQIDLPQIRHTRQHGNRFIADIGGIQTEFAKLRHALKQSEALGIHRRVIQIQPFQTAQRRDRGQPRGGRARPHHIQTFRFVSGRSASRPWSVNRP